MTYTYNYNFDSSDAVLGGMLVGYLITFLVIYVLSVIAMWKIFTKAGKPGWASLIPIYNIVELDMSDGDEKQLRVNLIVNKWNINNFVRDEEHCKEYFVDLPKEENRWKHENKTPVLPDGVSIREIRCLYSDHMNHKKIINMMYDNLYDSSQNDYCNDRKFIAKVYADNKWVELWHLLNS